MTSNQSKRKSTRRRGNGEGSIFLRNDGRWTGSISLGYGGNGKRKRRTVYGKSKKECQDKLMRLQNQKLDGIVADLSRITVKDFLDRWLDDSVRPNSAHNTFLAYQSAIRNHLVPSLGNIQLAKLSPAHIQGMLADLERKGVKPGLRNQVHKILGASLNQALKWNLILKNVCSLVRPPKKLRKEMRPFTAEQARTLLEYAKGDRCKAVYVLALTTGMRQGEILALHWEDIDFESSMLSVRHTLTWKFGKPKLTEPKTERSKRAIDLPALAIDALLTHKRRVYQDQGSLLFHNVRGKPVDGSCLVKWSFRPLLKKADLPQITFHSLRHSVATLMLKEGIHPKIVQERLGHSNISTTLDIYSHVQPTMQKEASEKIDRLLSNN